MTHAGLFATVAREYADFRPGYPDELFTWLARSAPGREAAWDCGCGSGQASVALAAHFDRVHATDAAPEQIRAARSHPRVQYSVAPAERSGLPSRSVDLITVAQALHWFDVDAFYAEARRVARPGAVLAAWTYPRPEFADRGLDRVFEDFYARVVGPFWPPERRHVESRYQTLPFPSDQDPLAELTPPPFALELRWSLDQVLGYVSSWSATARYRKHRGMDPVPELGHGLRPLWPAHGIATLDMPLALRVARLSG